MFILGFRLGCFVLLLLVELLLSVFVFLRGVGGLGVFLRVNRFWYLSTRSLVGVFRFAVSLCWVLDWL